MGFCDKNDSNVMDPNLEQLPSLAINAGFPMRYDLFDDGLRFELHNDALNSCFLFAKKLFGFKEDCRHEGIILRPLINQLTGKVIQWNTVQVGNWLFIQIPANASRDSFVNLLHYVEDNVDVKSVIACVERNSQNFNALVKTFRFIGFYHVRLDRTIPRHLFTEYDAKSSAYHYLSYRLG